MLQKSQKWWFLPILLVKLNLFDANLQNKQWASVNFAAPRKPQGPKTALFWEQRYWTVNLPGNNIPMSGCVHACQQRKAEPFLEYAWNNLRHVSF